MNYRQYGLYGIVVLLCLAGAAVALHWDQAAFEAWKADLNPWMFFLLMAVAPAFGVPASPFYLIAGLSFGALLGLGGSALAIAANLVLSYGIAKSTLRRLLDQLLANRKFQLPQNPPKRPIRYVVLIKLTPGLPTCLKNYALVLSQISFPSYFTISFLFSFGYALMFYYLGDALEDREVGQGGALVVGILLLGGIAWVIARRRKRLV
ncbi:MAG: TVP38/TMEM64 family protein [Opitutales bacterium]